MRSDQESWVEVLRGHITTIKLALDLLASGQNQAPRREHLLRRALERTELLAAELRRPPQAATRIPADAARRSNRLSAC